MFTFLFFYYYLLNIVFFLQFKPFFLFIKLFNVFTLQIIKTFISFYKVNWLKDEIVVRLKNKNLYIF